MYQIISNRTGDLSEHLVMTDLVRRGWVYSFPSSRDSIYDLVVELHDKKFITIQVKSLNDSGSFSTETRGGAIEFYGSQKNGIGQQRFSRKYADENIDWMVGVCKQTEKLYYYHIDKYRLVETVNVKKILSDDFPINNDMIQKRERSPTKKKSVKLPTPLF